MASIVWTDTFTAGATLTAAQLEQMKTDITDQVNGSIEAANIAASTITTGKLASPNAAFSILVKPCDTNAAAGTSTPGLSNNLSGLSTHVQIPAACTAIGISVYCRALVDSGSGNNDAQLFVGGTGVDSAVSFTAGDVINSGTFSQALLTTDTIEIRCNTPSTAGDGVSDPHVWIHCKAAHQA